MKAFKFSLQPLRTLRERQEQAALQDYAGAIAARQQALDQLAAAEQARDGAWARWLQQVTEGSSALDLAQLHDFCASLERARLRCAGELRVAEDGMHAALERLLAARKATAVVDRFFEVQRREHLLLRRKHEQKLLDELSQKSSSRGFSDEPVSTTHWN